jgi:hypothetical protein
MRLKCMGQTQPGRGLTQPTSAVLLLVKLDPSPAPPPGQQVNTASRMESHGFPMCVHLSPTTAAELQSKAPHVGLAPLGVRPVKGKVGCAAISLSCR